MFPEVLFRCENVGRQRVFANFWHFLTWLKKFSSQLTLFKPKSSIGLKKTEIMWENVKNLRNHVVGRRFHNDTKPWKTFHCASLQIFFLHLSLEKNSTICQKISLSKIAYKPCVFRRVKYCVDNLQTPLVNIFCTSTIS